MDAAVSNPYCIGPDDSFTTGPNIFGPNGIISNKKKTIFPEVIPVDDILWVGETTKQVGETTKPIKFFQREGTFTALTGEGTLGSFKIIVQFLGVLAKPVDTEKLRKQAEDKRKHDEDKENARRMLATQESNNTKHKTEQAEKSRQHAKELAADPEKDRPIDVDQVPVVLTYEQKREVLHDQLRKQDETEHLEDLKSQLTSSTRKTSVAKDPDWHTKHVQRGPEQFSNTPGARNRADPQWDEQHAPGPTEQSFYDQAALQRWQDREHARLEEEANSRVAHHMQSEDNLRRDRTNDYRNQWVSDGQVPPRPNQSQISYIPTQPQGTTTRPIVQSRNPERRQASPAWR